MSKRLLTLFLSAAMLISLFCCNTGFIFADDAPEIEDFNSYDADYSLAAVNGKTVSNGSWSVSDSGNATGTAAKEAKDILTLESESDSEVQSNFFGRVTRSWPEGAASSDKLSNMYFKRTFKAACSGTVTASMRLRLRTCRLST